MRFTADPSTLLLVLTVTCAASMIVTLAQLRNRRSEGSTWWEAGQVASALAWLLWSPIPLGLPEPVVMALGALAMFAVPLCITRSLFAFARIPPPHGVLVAMAWLMLVATVVWSDAWQVCSAIFNLGIAVVFAVAVRPLLRQLPDVPTGLRGLVAASLLITASSMVLRAGTLILSSSDPSDVKAVEWGEAVSLLGSLAGLVVANLGYVLMLRARAKASYTRLARLDPLTGVLNSAGLLERIAALADSPAVHGRPVSFLLVDLLDLSGINCRRGHLAGDHILREIADRLGQELPRAWIGRVADDRFLALIPGSRASAEELAQRLGQAAGTGELDYELVVGWASGRLGEDDPLRLVAAAESELAVAKRRRAGSRGAELARAVEA